MKFNIPLLPHYFSFIILSQVDKIMIENMFGSNYVGMYAVAYSVASVMNVLVTSINATYTPWVYQKIKSKELGSIKKNSGYLILTVAVATFIPVLLGPEVMRIFAPKEYLDAVWVIPPVTISVYFMFLYCVFGNIEFYFEQSFYTMIASVIAALANIILNLLFLPRFGYIAAGYTTLVCYMALALLHYFFMRRVAVKFASGYKFFNDKMIIWISIILMILCMVFTIAYKFKWIRYSLFTFCIWYSFLKKEKIFHIFRQVKNK